MTNEQRKQRIEELKAQYLADNGGQMTKAVADGVANQVMLEELVSKQQAAADEDAVIKQVFDDAAKDTTLSLPDTPTLNPEDADAANAAGESAITAKGEAGLAAMRTKRDAVFAAIDVAVMAAMPAAGGGAVAAKKPIQQAVALLSSGIIQGAV